MIEDTFKKGNVRQPTRRAARNRSDICYVITGQNAALESGTDCVVGVNRSLKGAQNAALIHARRHHVQIDGAAPDILKWTQQASHKKQFMARHGSLTYLITQQRLKN